VRKSGSRCSIVLSIASKFGNVNIVIFFAYTESQKLPTVSDSDDIAWFNVYIKDSVISSFCTNVSTEGHQFIDIMIPSVKASKYGMLGLDSDTLHLTHGHHHGKKSTQRTTSRW